MKRMALLLMLLAVLAVAAIPALALPPQCSCTYCTLNSGSNCTIVSPSGNRVVGCGTYYGTYCTMPN